MNHSPAGSLLFVLPPHLDHGAVASLRRRLSASSGSLSVVLDARRLRSVDAGSALLLSELCRETGLTRGWPVEIAKLSARLSRVLRRHPLMAFRAVTGGHHADLEALFADPFELAADSTR